MRLAYLSREIIWDGWISCIWMDSLCSLTISSYLWRGGYTPVIHISTLNRTEMRIVYIVLIVLLLHGDMMINIINKNICIIVL